MTSLPSALLSIEESHQPHCLVALVADLLRADTLQASRAAGVPGYPFFPSKMCMLSVMLDLPSLDVEVDGEFCDLREHVRLPGCLAVPRKGSATPTMGGSRWWPRRPGRPPSIGCGDPVCCACGDLGDFFSTAYSEENGDWDLDSDHNDHLMRAIGHRYHLLAQYPVLVDQHVCAVTELPFTGCLICKF